MSVNTMAKSYLRKFLGADRMRAIQDKQRQMGLAESGPFVSHMAALVWPSMFEAWHRKRTFQDIYQNSRWGSASGEKFYSGQGSRGQAVEVYVACISNFILGYRGELGREIVVVDLGCGDFSIGQQLVERCSGIKYIGCDLVPELIEHHMATSSFKNASFRKLDIVSDQLPAGDIVLIRQVFQHLSNNNVMKVISKLNIYSKILVTEGQPLYRQGPLNPDKPIGSGMRFDWRIGRGRGLELDQPPFNLTVEELCRAKSTEVEEAITYNLVLSTVK